MAPNCGECGGRTTKLHTSGGGGHGEKIARKCTDCDHVGYVFVGPHGGRRLDGLR